MDIPDMVYNLTIKASRSFVSFHFICPVAVLVFHYFFMHKTIVYLTVAIILFY
jgi:VIT1/CCC1 family predicted Fe2+/Mn2+ transporter